MFDRERAEAGRGARQPRPRSSPPSVSAARVRGLSAPRSQRFQSGSRSPGRPLSPGRERLRDFTSNVMRAGASPSEASSSRGLQPSSTRDLFASLSKGNSSSARLRSSPQRDQSGKFFSRPASSPRMADRSSALDRFRHGTNSSTGSKVLGSAYDFLRTDSDRRQGGSPLQARPQSFQQLNRLSPPTHRPRSYAMADPPRQQQTQPWQLPERPFSGPSSAAPLSSQPLNRLQALSKDFSSGRR
mmetsp:Transcript_20006/g.55589  ORF Transcript_20006/g.55589 Transcript_20006/m.55589 type:complete len:243 (+) Transcript_20006:1306-2034(+)